MMTKHVADNEQTTPLHKVHKVTGAAILTGQT